MKRTAKLLALIPGVVIGLCLISQTTYAQSACHVEYQVISQWGSGSANKIVVKNNGAAMSSWQLSWDYTGDDKITSMYNGSYTQTGKSVLVRNVPWNGQLATGAVVEVGFNVSSPSSVRPKVLLNGVDCSAQTGNSSSSSSVASSPSSLSSASSVASSVTQASSSLASSSTASSQLSLSSSSTVQSSSIASSVMQTSSSASSVVSEVPVALVLDSANSMLSFVTTKNIHTVESHRFGSLTGEVSVDGVATLEIDLNSVDTGIEIRNNRMKQMLFETDTFPRATVSLSVDPELIENLEVSEKALVAVSASVDLHGVNGLIETQLHIQKLSESRIMVKNVTPLIVTGAEYSLEAGIEALKTAANLNVISRAVPVDFVLFYEAP